jgi:hypothetical protein
VRSMRSLVTEPSGNLPPGQMTAHAGAAYGLRPYDLVAPTTVLVPAYHHAGQQHDTKTLILGQGDEAARFTRHDWAACGHRCHDAETYVVLSVPCDNMPHCATCECGGGHEHRLSDAEIQQIKGFLP